MLPPMPDPEKLSIAELRRSVRDTPVHAAVHAQIDELRRKDSAAGKPYWEARFRDGSDVLTLRAWSDSAAFTACEESGVGDPVMVSGEFFLNGTFGMDARRWTLRPLTPDEQAALLEGTPAEREARDADWGEVTTLVAGLRDPRLAALCGLFCEEFGPRFRRAAAARHNHHAHRGGLLRHTAQMLRAAAALAAVYPALNRDLLLTGILFHDSGKLWEMCPPENGFDIPRELRGELLGHISIGIELVNALWRRLPLDTWSALTPASEDVRLHVLHLIAAHHGQLEFGSPVEPKTPEAIALHYIDNLDARLEMIFSAYKGSPEIAPGIHERSRPLNVSPVRALPAAPDEASH